MMFFIETVVLPMGCGQLQMLEGNSGGAGARERPLASISSKASVG